MKKFASLLVVLLFLLGNTETGFAQFEGKIVYNSYEISPDGDRENKDNFTMFVTKDRILLQGDNSYDFMGDIRTEGVLVRLDFKDFVFLTGDDKALQISKADITSLMNMFGGDDNSISDSERDFDYQQTGETTKINGYACEKFIFREEDEDEDYAIVWMTKDLDINWGMMAEPWGEQIDDMIIDNVPVNLIFKEGYMPVKIDAYDSGRLQMVTEAEEIIESSIAKAMVQIPSGVNVLSFQDYLFQRLSEQ